MIKEFISANLRFQTVDPFTEKKTSLTLQDLKEDADYDSVVSIRTALQDVLDEPIVTTNAIHTYVFA